VNESWHALSVKQPWAALLALGAKTVEVRTWKSKRRGRLLIHASKIPDPRPEAWAWLTTPELRIAAEQLGGIVGVGEFVGCLAYPTIEEFSADCPRHLNEPAWFREQGLFGLEFQAVRPVPFYPCLGNTFFFPVKGFSLH